MNAPLASAPPIRTVDVIRKKRDGVELSRAEIEYLVRGYTSGEIPDYQAAAWLMSAVIRGLTRLETAALTDAMLRSGEVLDLSEFSAKKIDKHSTGGVGDKTSLVLAPVAAAAAHHRIGRRGSDGCGTRGGGGQHADRLAGSHRRYRLEEQDPG